MVVPGPRRRLSRSERALRAMMQCTALIVQHLWGSVLCVVVSPPCYITGCFLEEPAIQSSLFKAFFGANRCLSISHLVSSQLISTNLLSCRTGPQANITFATTIRRTRDEISFMTRDPSF
jgi:hypothetical protein